MRIYVRCVRISSYYLSAHCKDRAVDACMSAERNRKGGPIIPIKTLADSCKQIAEPNPSPGLPDVPRRRPAGRLWQSAGAQAWLGESPSAQVPNQRRARGADRALQLSRLYCTNARTHRSAGRPPVSVRGVPVCCLLEQTRSQKRNACCREKAAASSIITV